VFGVALAIIVFLYAAVILRWGFAIGWRGISVPPMWILRLAFYVWPIVAAFLIASVIELSQIAIFRRN
jgi:hypothetical protein